MIPIPVLADIKSVGPALERAWVGVRDKQFCHRGTPYDPPYRALVLVSDGVHDDALPGGEAQAELPALPANLPAADFEARAIGLDDLKRFEIVSQRSDAIAGIGARAAWQWHYAQVLHPYYRHIIEVHDGMKAVDRLGVRVVIRPLAIEQQRPRDSGPASSGAVNVPIPHASTSTCSGLVMPRAQARREPASQPWSRAHTERIRPASRERVHQGPSARTRPSRW